MNGQTRKFKYFITHSMLKNSLILTLPLLLLACGTNTETVQNPFGDDDTVNSDYSGPNPAGDAQKDFQDTVWTGLKAEARCGQCHDSDGGQTAFVDETDVNKAYTNALSLMDTADPAKSILVTKVLGDPSINGDGHNCWEQFESVCAASIENMISNFAGTSDNTTARAIQLASPQIKNPGDSKNYPETASDNSPDSFFETVYPLLTQRCVSCHYEEGITQQQAPFFANPDDEDSAYEAAKPKINIDLPVQSRLVQRLLEGHNCWSDCGSINADTGEISAGSNAREMFDKITAFASIDPVEINENLVTSKALTMLDGIVASGGNRHEADTIALYEFKTGKDTTAFDTSGVEPAMNLEFTGSVTWLGAYGLDFTGGKVQASTYSSKKLHDLIKISGDYSIEAWVIPANVTQEEASIIGYDVGSNQKNFALSQTLYNYNFANRTDQSESDGNAALSSEDAGEILQSSLQHVVVTYSVIDGRKIYVNGELLNVSDPVPASISTSIASWNDSYAFTMGMNANNEETWLGKIRFAAIHRAELTPAQVLQNFEAGVGQKYFLLFSISEQLKLNNPGCVDAIDPSKHNCFIQFEASQFDDYSYLFEKPTFINLDSSWLPGGFNIRNMRIGINGKEAVAGQSFASLDTSVNSTQYSATEGQLLTPSGAVIALEKGFDDDEFFLTFEVLDGEQHEFIDPPPVTPVNPPDPAIVSDIGVRTFDEINATIAAITGIAVTNTAVDALFQQYRQQLPTVENIDAFLSSHQMAIAQLALTSCSERVDFDSNPANTPVMFSDMDFTENAQTAFNNDSKRGYAIDPILNAVFLTGLATSPDHAELSNLLGAETEQTLTWNTLSGTDSEVYNSLITEMTQCPTAPTGNVEYDVNDPDNGDPHFKLAFPCDPDNDINTVARTAQIVKALCAAAVGSAAMLIQ